MLGTFSMVLVFTILKEGWEDIAWHKSDRDLNNKLSLIYNPNTDEFVEKRWKEI